MEIGRAETPDQASINFPIKHSIRSTGSTWELRPRREKRTIFQGQVNMNKSIKYCTNRCLLTRNIIPLIYYFSLTGRHNDLSKDNIPGPGQYVHGNNLNGPKFGFGTEKRGKALKDNSPGPGHYKVPVKVADVNKYVMPGHTEEFKYV